MNAYQSGASGRISSETPEVQLILVAVGELTSGGADSGRDSSMGGDEEGLDEGAKRIDNVSEYLGRVLLHVIRLTEGAKKGSADQ